MKIIVNYTILGSILALVFTGCKNKSYSKLDLLSFSITDSLVNYKIPLSHLHYDVSNKETIKPYVFYPEKGYLLDYSSNFKQVLDTLTFPDDLVINAIQKKGLNDYYLLTDSNILTFDGSNIISKVSIYQNDSVWVGQFSCCDNFPFVVYNDIAYLQLLDGSCVECPEISLEVNIDLKTNFQQKMPVYRSNKFKEHFFPTSLKNIGRIVRDSIFIYSFIADENIHTFNIFTGDKNDYSARSSFQKVDIYGVDKDNIYDRSTKNMDYFKTVPQYGRFVFDPFNKVYYRTFLQGQSLMKNDSTFNTWYDRRSFIMVLDEDFNLLGEIETDNEKYSYGIFPTNNGLAVPRRKLVNNKPQYDIFKINF